MLYVPIAELSVLTKKQCYSKIARSSLPVLRKAFTTRPMLERSNMLTRKGLPIILKVFLLQFGEIIFVCFLLTVIPPTQKSKAHLRYESYCGGSNSDAVDTFTQPAF
jgi:hypothetical protein